LRAFDGTYVQPSLRKVISRHEKRSFLQRWTVSAGYRRREKHSTYIICSGEEILLRSHQGRYLSSNDAGCPVSTTGIGRKPDHRLWWRVVRHNEDKSRSSTDFVRSFQTRLSPIRSGDLVRLVSLSSGHTLCSSNNEICIAKSKNESIRAQHLFTIVIESMDLYPRPVRMLAPTLRLTGTLLSEEKERRVKQVLMTSRCLSSKVWVMISVLSDGLVTVFSPSSGCQVRFRLDPSILGKECTCSTIVSEMCLATPDLGLAGGVTFTDLRALSYSLSAEKKKIQEEETICVNSYCSPETRERGGGGEEEETNIDKIKVRMMISSNIGGMLDLRCDEWNWNSTLFVDIDSMGDSRRKVVEAFVRHVNKTRLLKHRARQAQDLKKREILKQCTELKNSDIAEFALNRRHGSIEAAVKWIKSGRAEKVYLAHMRTLEVVGTTTTRPE